MELEGAEIQGGGQSCSRSVGGYGHIGDVKTAIDWGDPGIFDAIYLTAEAGPKDGLLAGIEQARVGAFNHPQMGGGGEPQQARLLDLYHPGINNNQLLLWQPVDNDGPGRQVPAGQSDKTRPDLARGLGHPDQQHDAIGGGDCSWIEGANDAHIRLGWSELGRCQQAAAEQAGDHLPVSASSVAAHAMARELRPFSSVIRR